MKSIGPRQLALLKLADAYRPKLWLEWPGRALVATEPLGRDGLVVALLEPDFGIELFQGGFKERTQGRLHLKGEAAYLDGRTMYVYACEDGLAERLMRAYNAVRLDWPSWPDDLLRSAVLAVFLGGERVEADPTKNASQSVRRAVLDARAELGTERAPDTALDVLAGAGFCLSCGVDLMTDEVVRTCYDCNDE